MTNAPKSTDFSRTQAPRPGWLAKAVPEPAIDPDRPIIDTHMHLWDHATGYQYFVPDYEVGRRYQMVMRAMYLPYESPEQIDEASRLHRNALLLR